MIAFLGPREPTSPATRVITNPTRNTKKSTCAVSVMAEEIPPKPIAPAISATTKKMADHKSINTSLHVLQYRETRPVAFRERLETKGGFGVHEIKLRVGLRSGQQSKSDIGARVSEPFLIMKLAREDLRRLFLHSQGLDRLEPFGLGIEGTLRAIRQIGYVQIDTISVVPRAHHHILHSRVPDYRPQMLHDLQVQSRIFEYWSHAAAYLPIEDFRFAQPRMKRIQKTHHWFEKDKKVMREVLARIKKEGPLQSKDFEKPPGAKSGPWFEWKPHKKALESLFHEGRLLIRERRGFQKVYDLPERVLPSGLDTKAPSPREYARHLIERSMTANGFTSLRQAGHLRRANPILTPAFKDIVKKKEIVEFRVDGIKDAFFTTTELLTGLDFATLDFTRAKLLSPFDNAVIQRAPLKALFDFDYQVEFYLPAPKRKYGYFSLPILIGDRFIGRVDTKADRETKRLLLRNVCFENPGAVSTDDLAALAVGIHEFKIFCGCEEVVVEKTTPSKLKTSVRAALKG